MASSHSGSCFCGAVQLTINGEIRNVANCHCSRCRKFNGSAFSTYAVVSENSLDVTAGEGEIAFYPASERVHKRFCRRCGTPLFNTNARYPGFAMVFLGAFERPEDLRPQINVYCSTMLPWIEGISRFQSFPGAFEK